MRSTTTERILGVSARLLTGAAVLSVVATGLVFRFAWQQAGESFDPDGTPTDLGVPFANRLMMTLFDLSYRQVSVQLVLAAALVAAAVGALHLHPSWAQVRRLRWEVLGGLVIALVLVVALLLAYAYVLTTPEEESGVENWFGPQPITELSLASLTSLGAALLTLAVACLWWLRLEEAPDPEPDDDGGSAGEDAEDAEGAEDAGTGHRASPRSSRRDVGTGAGESADDPSHDWSRDWSPEDFRPPR